MLKIVIPGLGRDSKLIETPLNGVRVDVRQALPSRQPHEFPHPLWNFNAPSVSELSLLKRVKPFLKMHVQGAFGVLQKQVRNPGAFPFHIPFSIIQFNRGPC